jgi:DNA-binding IclR family transcriptional regulator
MRSTRPTTKTSTPSVDGGIQVLQTPGGILQSLAGDPELSAAQLAERVGEPRSSVYRLLASLRSLGYVEPGARQGTFRLGLELLRLGNAVSSRFDERRAALPSMQHLWEETGETIFLCVRRGFDAVCIERLDGERVQTHELKLGTAQPLHLGAAPRALLAFEPKELWAQYVAKVELVAPTSKTIATIDGLLTSLVEIRANGYVISDEDVTLGIAAVGAPVFDHQGRVRASVSISGTKPLILGDAERSIAGIARCAREISAALGWDSDEPPPLD